MAKAKQRDLKLEADTKPEREADSVEIPEPKQPGPTQEVPVRIIELPVYDALIKYLGTQPYNQVGGLIQSLSQFPVINVTVTK